MQFKLLQTYRVLSNFSISLIMEFIPFMIFGFALPVMGMARAIAMMFGYWVLQCLFVFIFSTLFQKEFFSKPQIFLLLRVFPIIACEICVLFLPLNSWWILIITAIFSGLENSFNYVPTEIIYNYVSEGQDEKTLGFTRFLEQMGWLIAGIAGGAFLDFLPQWLVVTFSLALFVGSAIPLVIFYYKFRKDPTFNKDFVSYAVAAREKDPKVKKLKKRFLLKHFISLALIAPTVYCFYYLTSAIMYIETGSFLIAGTVSSVYDGIYGVCCLFAGKLLTKYDGKNLTSFTALYMIVSIFVIYFVPIMWVKIFVFLLSAIIQPIINIHLFQSYLDKGRILGVGNEVLLNQYRGNCIGYSLIYIVGMFGMFPIIVASAGMAFLGVLYERKAEESTTKDLVDFLSFNETSTEKEN